MKRYVKTNVYWFTESSPNIHVQPSMGSKVTVAFSIDLAIGWDKDKLLYRTIPRHMYSLHSHSFVIFVLLDIS